MPLTRINLLESALFVDIYSVSRKLLDVKSDQQPLLWSFCDGRSGFVRSPSGPFCPSQGSSWHTAPRSRCSLRLWLPGKSSGQTPCTVWTMCKSLTSGLPEWDADQKSAVNTAVTLCLSKITLEPETWPTCWRGVPSRRCVTGSNKAACMALKLCSRASPWFTSLVWETKN